MTGAGKFLTGLVLMVLAGCGGAQEDLAFKPEPLGDFRLGFAIVVANDVTRGPGSREIEAEALTTAVQSAVEERFSRFEGDRFYHIALRIEAYILAAPGIPIIYSPRSLMLSAMTVFDDATQTKLNEEAIRVTAFEGIETGVPLIPSGMLKTREEQLENLAISTAREIERILREREEDWFALSLGDDPLQPIELPPRPRARPSLN